MYPAKVLLFGEYVVLLGARALALPLRRFGGEWVWANPSDAQGEALRAFAHSEALAQIAELDVAAFQREVAQGLVFRSDIPMGYGLGSSGALCAATYDRYARPKATDLATLRQTLALMESHFHGKSSGIDPLTSYANRPLLFGPGSAVERFEQRPWKGQPPVVFLLDTGLPRQTAPLVQWFMQQRSRPDFAARLEAELLPAHEALLNAWQDGNAAATWPLLRRLSAFQLAHLQPMIPPPWRQRWADTLARGEVVFKLCGAGGGGFLLGFAHSTSAAEAYGQQTNSPVWFL